MLLLQHTKWCPSCNCYHPVTEFSKSYKGNTFRYQSWCKAATNEYNRLRRLKKKADAVEVVYVVRTHDRVKIGITDDLPTRLSSMRSSSAYPIHLEWVEEGYADEERELHNIFAHRRLHGEWFEFPQHSTTAMVPQE